MAYVKLVRPHWILTSTLAAMIGIFQAWGDGSYRLPLAVLVVVGVMLNHAILEVWDELQDYAHYRKEVGVSTEPPTLFSGGSGVLTGQLLTVTQIWCFLFVLGPVGVIVLAAIVELAGWQVLLCVAVGVFIWVNYNWALKLSYRGFGEFANFISFGPIMVCSAYVALRLAVSGGNDWNLLKFLNGTIVAESLILGAVWFGSEHIQGMLDYDEDLAGNKRTLVVRFGKEYAARVPVVSAAVIVALTIYLSTVDLGFIIVLPAAILHLCETASFTMHWREEAYFMRKTKSYFVYRNFVLISVGILLSFFLRGLPHAAGNAALLPLILLTLASSAPAIAFLIRNRVFTFAAASDRAVSHAK